MGFPLTGMKKRKTVLAPLLAAAAFALFSFAGQATATPVDAASCADQPLQPVGASQLSACGVPKLSANPALTPELHYTSRGDNAGATTEANQPRANANLGRAGSGPAAGSAGAAAAPTQLPVRKTIDVTQLPAELVSPSR